MFAWRSHPVPRTHRQTQWGCAQASVYPPVLTRPRNAVFGNRHRWFSPWNGCTVQVTEQRLETFVPFSTGRPCYPPLLGGHQGGCSPLKYGGQLSHQPPHAPKQQWGPGWRPCGVHVAFSFCRVVQFQENGANRVARNWGMLGMRKPDVGNAEMG